MSATITVFIQFLKHSHKLSSETVDEMLRENKTGNYIRLSLTKQQFRQNDHLMLSRINIGNA